MLEFLSIIKFLEMRENIYILNVQILPGFTKIVQTSKEEKKM